MSRKPKYLEPTFAIYYDEVKRAYVLNVTLTEQIKRGKYIQNTYRFPMFDFKGETTMDVHPLDDGTPYICDVCNRSIDYGGTRFRESHKGVCGTYFMCDECRQRTTMFIKTMIKERRDGENNE